MAKQNITTCPVAVIAAEADRIADALQIADKALDSDTLNGLHEQLYDLRRAASRLQAQSPKGALFQLGAAAVFIDRHGNRNPDDVEAAASLLDSALRALVPKPRPADIVHWASWLALPAQEALPSRHEPDAGLVETARP